jgi:hypothetical protein
MQSNLVTLILGVVALGLFATPSVAIVVRHDVEQAQFYADPADYPAVFGLLRTRRGFWDCPAILIAPRWAVTAGHCASAPRITDGMRSGSYAVDIGGRANAIDRIAPYPGGADIALLHLSSPVTDIAPAPLYEGSDELGKTVVMLGWGDAGDGVQGIVGPDGQFRRATNVIDQAEGDIVSWTFSDPRAAHSDVTALEGISGPGDSGGPALIEVSGAWRLAGISSGQDPMGHARGSYGVREFYVRISAVRAWIVQTTRGQ